MKSAFSIKQTYHIPQNAMHDRMWPAQNQASLRYHEIEQASSPASPLDFPSPRVRRAAYFPASVLDHRSGKIHHVKHILACCNTDGHLVEEPGGDRAYLKKKRLCRSTYGSIRVCVVLKRRNESKGVLGVSAKWESTNELVVVKASLWDKVHSARGRNLEDPLKEAAALQFVGDYHKHINGCIEILQDRENLYAVMPYCAGGDLYTKVLRSSKDSSDVPSRINEMQARMWFRQLLSCLTHLEKKGMCHRDISLENLMLDENDNLVLIDFGIALRVPYMDCTNTGGVSDVSEGTCRCLIKRQGQSGNLTFLAPEVVETDVLEFDGFAVDLWSAGVVLFVLLVGMAPFEWAHCSDYRFRLINKGKLHDLLESMNLQVSKEAVHLLQQMLWRDPRKRLTLSEVLMHPWVVGSHCTSLPRLECIGSSKNESIVSKSTLLPVPAAGN